MEKVTRHLKAPGREKVKKGEYQKFFINRVKEFFAKVEESGLELEKGKGEKDESRDHCEIECNSPEGDGGQLVVRIGQVFHQRDAGAEQGADHHAGQDQQPGGDLHLPAIDENDVFGNLY